MFRAVAKRRWWMMHEDMQMSAIQQKFARRCAIHIPRPHPPHYPTATLLLPLLPLPSLTWKGRAGGGAQCFPVVSIPKQSLTPAKCFNWYGKPQVVRANFANNANQYPARICWSALLPSCSTRPNLLPEIPLLHVPEAAGALDSKMWVIMCIVFSEWLHRKLENGRKTIWAQCPRSS